MVLVMYLRSCCWYGYWVVHLLAMYRSLCRVLLVLLVHSRWWYWSLLLVVLLLLLLLLLLLSGLVI